MKNHVRYNEKLVHGKLTAEAPSSIGATIKGNCSIGFLSYIGRDSEIYHTQIGRFCSIAVGFVSGPTNHPTDRFSSHLFTFNNDGPFKGNAEYQKWKRGPSLPSNEGNVTIGNDVWIGRNVVIKRGIRIGDGAIIGAGSVVVKDVEPYSIVAGAPARLIRMRFSPAIINRLTALRWFDYRIDKDALPHLDVSNIESTLSTLEDAIERRQIELLRPQQFLITPSGMELIESNAQF